jgi:hypothetical protein
VALLNRLDHAALPLLIGTLLSSTPNEQPNTLVLSMSDGITEEVTLHLKDNKWKDSHVNGPLIRGSQIQFEGVPIAFTQNPFMGISRKAKIETAAKVARCVVSSMA